jgi:hypothetical protein
MRNLSLTVATIAVAVLTLTGCAAALNNDDEAPRTVTYDVISDGTTAGYVTYNSTSGTEQATGARLPFTKEIPLDDTAFEGSTFSLAAQSSAGATMITCTITVDGEKIAEQTSTGEFAVVSCAGTAG